MEGLLKLLLIVFILYLFGWLGKRGNRWVESMAARLKKLLCEHPDKSKSE
jgi:hypothetical protein